MYPSDDALAALPTPSAAAEAQRPPGAVLAAAVVTWVTASLTAAIAVCLGVIVLLFGGAVLDVFEFQYWRAYVVGTVVVVVALSATAGLLAYKVARGTRWARWALVVLSIASALPASMLGYYVAPLLITAAALAVVVLLFVRPARAWFRSTRT